MNEYDEDTVAEDPRSEDEDVAPGIDVNTDELLGTGDTWVLLWEDGDGDADADVDVATPVEDVVAAALLDEETLAGTDDDVPPPLLVPDEETLEEVAPGVVDGAFELLSPLEDEEATNTTLLLLDSTLEENSYEVVTGYSDVPPLVTTARNLSEANCTLDEKLPAPGVMEQYS